MTNPGRRRSPAAKSPKADGATGEVAPLKSGSDVGVLTDAKRPSAVNHRTPAEFVSTRREAGA
jgi:hypothetical protein